MMDNINIFLCALLSLGSFPSSKNLECMGCEKIMLKATACSRKLGAQSTTSTCIHCNRTNRSHWHNWVLIFRPTDFYSPGGPGLAPSFSSITESEMKDVAAEIMVFFIAGSDGVAIALTFSAYNLALHPEYQDKLVEEINEAMKKNGMTFEAINNMPLLEAVVKESLRMYTPDSFLTRRCNKETTLYGIDFKPGMCIELPLTGVHYNPEFFPEPYAFKPERFLPEMKDLLKPYSFLAFGAGPRNCIGLRVALVQAKTMLACVLRDVRFEICDETAVPVKFVPRRLLLEPTTEVKLRVVPRC